MEVWWERKALLAYAVMRATNAARSSTCLAGTEARRVLWQAAVEGAKRVRIMQFVFRAQTTRMNFSPSTTLDFNSR